MKNVYDIKKEKNLDYILPKNIQLREVPVKKLQNKVLALIHLHYIEGIEKYIKYIKMIPEYIDVIITIAKDSEIEKILIKELGHRVRILYKENRGRDISSFLVACREEILKYEYVCFAHDKKEKNRYIKEYTDNWVNSLWENVLGSREYINNIIFTFETNPRLGVITPPTMINDICRMLHKNEWDRNFENAKKLKQKLNLICNMNEDKPPFTLGTFFWGRVEALKKLFEYKWKYEDFDPEPLKGDGTISHAIERIFSYVSQDAGYDSGWVMTDEFAANRIEQEEILLRRTLNIVKNYLGIPCIEKVPTFNERIIEIAKFCSKFEKIYVYGAGACGKICKNQLDFLNIKIESFLVSKKEGNPIQVFDIPVRALEDISLNDECGIIIAVKPVLQDEIIETIKIKFKNFNNIYFFIKR